MAQSVRLRGHGLDRRSIADGRKTFLSSPKAFHSTGTGGYFPGSTNNTTAKLITHTDSFPRLQMSGAISPFHNTY
jgi:hypothetical protein